MSFFEIGPNDSLYYEYEPPSGNQPLTFVFINAITGDTGMWQAEIGPTLRDAGYGTLAFNFRGQAKSTASEGLAFDEALITGDLIRLLQHLNPPNPVLVGLSIGGLYGSWAYLGGIPAAGLVLVLTQDRAKDFLDERHHLKGHGSWRTGLDARHHQPADLWPSLAGEKSGEFSQARYGL